MTLSAQKFLARTFPEHQEFFLGQKTIRKLAPRDTPLPEAVVRVIAGQMLSSEAASKIYSRVTEARDREELVGSWLLDEITLRKSGLSSGKSKAVLLLAEAIGQNVSALDHWRSMTYEALEKEVCSFKGLGSWSAAIIALFYLGFEDVFPKGDASLNKALDTLEVKGSALSPPGRINTDLARPLRSYLALYLWQGLDTGLLKSATNAV